MPKRGLDVSDSFEGKLLTPVQELPGLARLGERPLGVFESLTELQHESVSKRTATALGHRLFHLFPLEIG
jgi:hypothetical protein